MKSPGNLLHRTPWWALLAAGFTLLVALGLFVTPFHLLRLERSGATPEENRAIKREIDTTFSEGAIDVAGSILREMRARTNDPARRAELDRALDEIRQARETLREAGRDAQQARREAARSAANAVKEVAEALREVQREADRKRKEGDAAAANAEAGVQESLRKSLEAAQKAREEELRAQAPPSPPAAPLPPAPRGPGFSIEFDDKPSTPDTPVTPLPPEMRAQIRQKVTGDLYRIGVGAGLILLFIPLFILAVVSKFFIDRSRAAQLVAESKRKEAEYHRMSRQVTEAKLSALQAQVEPHFLYNTLASVQALTEVDPARANAMTGHLIQYLRNALPKMRGSVSTVGQEVELVRAYLNILQMRMGKRLAFEISAPPELAELPFPPLMLPSLVENAIKHGLEPQREGGSVAITAESVDGKLRMTVADTGRGFGEVPGEGVGLANIRERLAALYGGAAKLTLEANEPHGVRATIEVPRQWAPAAGDSAPASAGPAKPAAPPGAAARTIAVMGSAERAWRKGLSFAFIVLVCGAAVLAGLGIVGVATGALPVHIGHHEVGGATGALLGTAGVIAAFIAAVLALAIVLAIVYGLGFLFVGLALFIPLVILVSLFPVLAPFILLGLGIWWLVRRSRRREPPKESPAPPSAAP
jgi:hypothetical protein